MVQAPELTLLNPAQAYALWAASYDRETAVSLLENRLVGELTPALAGLRLLDVGCGTGRRMAVAGAASATGVEPSAHMIAAGASRRIGRRDLTVLRGHAAELPVNDGSFDVVWCRLVLGHVAELEAPYAEMARALTERGTAVVSDFHPEAHVRGHRRTFRDADGVWEIESHVHMLSEHVAAAEAVGLVLVRRAEAEVSPAIRQFYADAGRLALYKSQLGLPLAFALRFEKA